MMQIFRFRSSCLTAAVLVGAGVATLARVAPARAQIAGVLTRPRPVRPARDSAAGPDTTTRVGRAAAKVPVEERQRLDIQAWVDSAAGALAQSSPAPIPAPGTGSIFNAPAVPDSLRPPAAPAPIRPRRGTRGSRRPTAVVPSTVVPSAARDLASEVTGAGRRAGRVDPSLRSG